VSLNQLRERELKFNSLSHSNISCASLYYNVDDLFQNIELLGGGSVDVV